MLIISRYNVGALYVARNENLYDLKTDTQNVAVLFLMGRCWPQFERKQACKKIILLSSLMQILNILNFKNMFT